MSDRISPRMTAACVVFLSVLVAAAASLSAQTLTVWVGDGTIRMDEYEVVARLFEEQNPGVKVELVSQGGSQAQIMEKIIIAIISGAPPDVTWLEGSGVIEFAAQGLLMDVTDVISDLKFAPSDTHEMTFNGRMWAVPYHTTSRGLFKKIDQFEQAGMDPYVDPKDLDELYAWNQRLSAIDESGNFIRAGFVPWSGNWGAPAWIWAFGGELIEVDGTTIRPTAVTPQSIAAFDWIRTWAQFFGNRTPAAGGFTGNVAMSAESTSAITRFTQDFGLRIAVGRVPHPPGGRNGTWGGGTAVGVPVNAPNPELSLKLARFFGEAEVQIQRYREAPHGLPANWDALIEVARELAVEYGPLIDQLPEARPRTPLWIEYYVQQLNPAMNQVVAGNLTPEEALAGVQRVMEARFADIFGR